MSQSELHRTISHMSLFTKNSTVCTNGKNEKKFKTRNIQKHNLAFFADKGTRNANFTPLMLMERCIEVQKELCLFFIDYSKAFNKVKHIELFKFFEKLDANGKDSKLLEISIEIRLLL